MKIINQSKKTVISENAKTAYTVLQRFKGLLGRKHFVDSDALVLKPCNSVHTFFMQFPIDILFVDRNRRVVKVISNLKPFRLSEACLKAIFAIELPSGKIQQTFTTPGDTIVIGDTP
ncbi:MAG: hypothetical protein A3G38_01985 [Omnitrophica WOR_2 bacterium RIFCSPLOWO2_12_FULL_51_8]|nr:MAG: hypothetical protein A3G38_01985 [Omnitrophica WOR_2 bacterium RIFCSPLOWO2_12_FULL_51_8]